LGIANACTWARTSLSIKFSTVRKIASFFVDFLFLLALHMDANRNQAFYMNPRNKKVDEFLGETEWRDRWKNLPGPKRFPAFLLRCMLNECNHLAIFQ